MSLSDLERLRRKIADKARLVLDEQIGTANGLQTAFQAQFWPWVRDSETIMVRDRAEAATGVVLERDTDYAVDYDLGLVVLNGAPGAGAEVIANYRWVTFTDEELEDLLGREGSVRRAAMEAIRWLLADTDRFIKYTFGQETVDRSVARQGLKDLLDELKRDGPAAGVLHADTDDREALMEPFVEQDEEFLDVA